MYEIGFHLFCSKVFFRFSLSDPFFTFRYYPFDTIASVYCLDRDIGVIVCALIKSPLLDFAYLFDINVCSLTSKLCYIFGLHKLSIFRGIYIYSFYIYDPFLLVIAFLCKLIGETNSISQIQSFGYPLDQINKGCTFGQRFWWTLFLFLLSPKPFRRFQTIGWHKWIPRQKYWDINWGIRHLFSKSLFACLLTFFSQIRLISSFVFLVNAVSICLFILRSLKG